MITKPSELEEEYVAKMEFEKKKKLEEEKQRKLADEEKTKLKDLHFMKCPKCGMQLIEIEYKGMRVDRCSGCEGIWLDRGELASIVSMEKTTLDKLFKVFRKHE